MEKNLNSWKDSLGIVASVTCAIHCAATPILLALLPALKFTEWMASPRFHQIAAIVCVGLVSFAIWPAFQRFRDFRVLSLSTLGLVLLIAAAFFLPNECCSHTHASFAAHDSHAGHHHPGGDGSNHDSHGHSSHDHASSELTTVRSSTPEMVALIQPWMTPIGGVLLVLAHTLNLRRRIRSGNQCECNCHSRVAAPERYTALRTTADSQAA